LRRQSTILDTAHLLIEALPEVLGELSRQEQEQLEMALISRIDVDRDNQVSITLCLDADAIRALPNLRSDSSRPPESPR
jgi:hypothetical protein